MKRVSDHVSHTSLMISITALMTSIPLEILTITADNLYLLHPAVGVLSTYSYAINQLIVFCLRKCYLEHPAVTSCWRWINTWFVPNLPWMEYNQNYWIWQISSGTNSNLLSEYSKRFVSDPRLGEAHYSIALKGKFAVFGQLCVPFTITASFNQPDWFFCESWLLYIQTFRSSV